MSNRATIITAGGSGQRMKNDIPKQFILLGNIPILMHTIRAFHLFDPKMKIVVSLPKEHFEYWKKLTEKHNFNIQVKIVEGGKTRFHSISNALKEVQDSQLVAIHDGVRPFVSKEMIAQAFETAKNHHSAVPVCQAIESTRMLIDNYKTSVPRHKIFNVQTPQCFHTQKILEAYGKGYNEKYTDDASVFEDSFGELSFFEGISENLKITNPIDLAVAESYLDYLSNSPSFPHISGKNGVNS